MKKKLNKTVKDTNLFLSRFLSNQKRTDLIKPMRYGLLPGGKKIRSKLILDVGKIFKIKYQNGQETTALMVGILVGLDSLGYFIKKLWECLRLTAKI